MIRSVEPRPARGGSARPILAIRSQRRNIQPSAIGRRDVSSEVNADKKLKKSDLKDRAQRLLGREIAFIHNPSFRRATTARMILVSAPLPIPDTTRLPRIPEGTPAYFADLYSTPLLTQGDEQHLFRKMNFLKFRANQLRAGLDLSHPTERVVTEIEQRLAQAAEIRESIIRANLRLVVSIARRFADAHNDFDDLVSDGNLTLMNAVEKFDYARGFRFSTYATHAIQRDFYRQCRRRRTDQTRFVRGIDEFIADAPDDETDPLVAEHFRRYGMLLELIEGELDEREQYVLTMRFGLDHDAGPQTLQTIGTRLGVSKERVRQLELRAIDTLQRVARAETVS
jgi:RNA polymerase primary sigma factor